MKYPMKVYMPLNYETEPNLSKRHKGLKGMMTLSAESSEFTLEIYLLYEWLPLINGNIALQRSP